MLRQSMLGSTYNAKLYQHLFKLSYKLTTLGDYAKEIRFTHATCGPMVRSSYHVDKQASGEEVK